MTRKLSMILLKFHSVASVIRGEIMRFKRKCTENPSVLDDWNRDEEGIETLVQCNNKPEEKKRY